MSVVVAGRDAAPPRGRDRPGGQDPQDRPGRDDDHGRGLVATRATSTRASTSRRSTSCRSSSSSRTTATRSACPAAMRGRRSRTSPTGRPATASRASSSTAPTSSPATRRRARRSTRARAGEGPTLIEAKVTRLTAHSSDDQQTKYRSAEELDGRAAATTRCRASATQLRDAGVLTDEIEARIDAPRSRPRSRTRPTTPRPSPTRTRRPRCATSTPRTGRRDAAAVGPSGARTDADPHVHRGDPRDARRGDAPRRDGHRPGRGRRQEGRRLPRHRRPVGRVRRRPGHRHAADRVDDRRRVDRRGGQRPAPGRRDPVRRLHLPGLQPDRVRGGPDALSLEQRLRRADDDPRAVRRRRPRRALPLAVGRGVLHPRARASRSSSRRRRTTRKGLLRTVDPRRRPGPLLRAQEDVPLASAATCPTRDYTVPARPGRRSPTRARRSRSSPTG